MSSFRKPMIARRITAGAYDATTGKYGGEVEVPFQIRASVQPAMGKDLQAVAEGRRMLMSFVLYTKTALRGLLDDSGKSQNPDRIELFGNDCEIVVVKPWQSGVISHYWALAQKIQPGGASLA